MKKPISALVFLIGMLLWAPSVCAVELRIAVAANFTATLERLAEVYAPDNGVRFAISSGSSGKHFAQIRQGAPFDIFFSADAERTADLITSGHAVADSGFIYARGILALWSPTPGVIPEDGIAFLKSGNYRRIAIANPRVAPYGVAAEAVLNAYGVHLGPRRLTTGQSIGQAFSFVSTGNAEIGFVALSQVIAYERQRPIGSRWLPSFETYPPILQEAVLLTAAREPDAARSFLDWVRTSEAARVVIESDGYRL